jgi:hypothetical protein
MDEQRGQRQKYVTWLGFASASRRVTLQEKEFSALQKAKSRTTKEITALGKHHCTPLTSVRNRSTFEANTGNI